MNAHKQSSFLLDRHALLKDPRSIDTISSVLVRKAILKATKQRKTKMSGGGFIKITWTKSF